MVFFLNFCPKLTQARNQDLFRTGEILSEKGAVFVGN